MSAVAAERAGGSGGGGGSGRGARVKGKTNSTVGNGGSGAANSASKSNMLTTPKMESAGGMSSLISPRGFPTPRFTPSAGLTNGHAEREAAEGGGSSDMLTTPKPWESLSATGADFPVRGSAATTPPPEPPEPPRNLPLVSDIGLRSPCDGMLAKRRKMFKDMKQVSSNSAGDRSDSNSCDTPTSSQNSPRDMTMGASETSPTSLTAPAAAPPSTSLVSSSSSSSASKVQVKLEFPDSTAPAAPAARPPFQSSRFPDSAGFKHPSMGLPPLPPSSTTTTSKPESLRSIPNAGEAASAAGTPSVAHVTPSPLALVPSPNLSAIERNFGSALLKTPKLLDINVFDFIPERANLPASSSSSTSMQSRSPGCEVSGRDQLPRSPRFSIPEAPTDLSNKSPAAASTGSSSSSNAASQSMPEPPPYPSEAEDLSVTRLKVDVSPSPPQPPHHSQPNMQQPQLLTLKQEYSDPAGSR